MEWFKKDFKISDNVELINLQDVTQLLSTTYWASNRTKEIIEKSINNSLAFGLYHSGKQIGFARVVTDKAVFSWVLDVVIDDNYRGNGLGQWLMECIFEHPEIKFTAFALATSDAHDFYKKFDFKDNVCMTKPLLC
ncbi:GNAT family N-acetyltransferase [Jeotgalibacillus sp. ET6]|uniref:GNAT family N-acetyltransferase n=1 Tax=Jeotgalibacillus sp. ET6 TaxID=3037260 RepID=UPI002418A786|nr:GNAT family N-acetyltransferase [Jeotgalibacillus sp. ET6]MDG5472746.1 GNAT family N-acetyltransferase [Jeotgalibacillus sp. ET6]